MRLIQFPKITANEKAARRNARQEVEIKEQQILIEKLKQRLREK